VLDQNRLLAKHSARKVRTIIRDFPESEIAYLIYEKHPGGYTPREWRAVMRHLRECTQTVGEYL